MNDKDKKAFTEWYKNKESEFDNCKEAWQAALEYERNISEKAFDLFNKNIDVLGDEIYKLQAENKKLREALQWYADRKNCDNPDFAHVEIDEHGEEIADGGYRAREALKEVSEV
jgi:hypothetical protein